MNHDLKYGLILGLISVTFTAVILMIDYTLMVEAWWVGFINFGITIAILILAGMRLRSAQGGTLSFKEAFLSAWLIIVIAGGLNTAYSFVQFNLISPELPGKIQKAVINESASMMQNLGVDDNTIDEAVAELEKENSFSLNNLLLSFLYTSILGGAVLAAIIALIVRKKPDPEFR